MGSYPYPRNGIIKIDYEFILLFKKPGLPPPVSKEVKERSALSVEEWNEYFAGHWNFPGEKQEKHLAMFPEELPRRLIRMFSFAEETVLDPFLGSGTTSLAAEHLERNSIGYEVNESFIPLIGRKVGAEQGAIFSRTELEFVKPDREAADYSRAIQVLPYVFHDPIKFDKKIDPRKMTFGSKIDANGNGKEEFFRLKRVIAPNMVELTNDMVVRLIGIRSRAGKEPDAMKWLWERLKGQSVSLKFDQAKFDEENHLLSYVYLKNKTFVNLHLLRSNLVQLDESFPFRYRERFRAVMAEEPQL